MIDYKKIREDYARCYVDRSRIYLITKYLRTFDATQGREVPFQLFPRQRAFLQALAENKNIVAIKPRQCGITTLTSAWVTAQCALASSDSPETVLCIANKLEQAQEIIIKIRNFLEQIPRWFWGDEYFSIDPKSEKNTKSIFVKDAKGMIQLFNGCRIIARASGPNAARGISAVSVLILDEAAFIEEGAAVYATASATMASNPRAKTVMVSTPNGKDELYYTTYRQALAKENNFTAVQFRWYQDPRFNKWLVWKKKDPDTGEWLVDEDMVVGDDGAVKYDEERWSRLEREGWKPDSPWYEDMCKSFNNDSMKIAQELDVSFMGSADNVVAAEYIEMQERLNVREPIDYKDPIVEETWYWKKPIEGHRYIMGVDPSMGVSADRTAIEIIDLDGRDENGMPIIEQVMEYVGRKLGDDIATLIYNYATSYHNAYVVVDCTGGYGNATILALLNMGYKNLYYEDNSQKTYTVQNSTKNYDSYTDRLPGFHFQGTRSAVLYNFAGLVRNNEFKIRSSRVINELNTWIFKSETGRMDHMAGAHDDTICALAMALFVMQFSFLRVQSTINKDKTILNSYMMANNSRTIHNHVRDGQPIIPNNGLPMYNGQKMNSKGKQIIGPFMWVFGGLK